jgi:hypothetical protein
MRPPRHYDVTPPYSGRGWRKNHQARSATYPDKTPPTTLGRRLTRAEIQQAAAEMGMPVTAYRRETEAQKAERAKAFAIARAQEAKARPAIPVSRTRNKRPKKKKPYR